MSVVELNAHSITQTRLCKVAHCEQDATASRGPYAGLCDEHKRERQAGRLPRVDAPSRTSPAAVPSTSRAYEQRVRELLPVARELDRALAAYAPKREALREAMKAWALAVEALS